MKKKPQNPDQAQPTLALIFARARIRAAFQNKDRGQLKAAQVLYRKELAAIFNRQRPKSEQMELPFDADHPRGRAT